MYTLTFESFFDYVFCNSPQSSGTWLQQQQQQPV